MKDQSTLFHNRTFYIFNILKSVSTLSASVPWGTNRTVDTSHHRTVLVMHVGIVEFAVTLFIYPGHYLNVTSNE